MADTERNLPPVPIQAPLQDQSGKLSMTWMAWFRQLYFRVGGSDALTNLELEAGSVGSVGTDQLQDGAVTNPKLHSDAVSTSKVQDSAITTPKINALSITTPKVADAAITLAKLDTHSVDTSKLVDEAVTTDKLDSQAVTIDKMSGSGGLVGQSPRINALGLVDWEDPPASAAVGGSLVTDGDGNNQINISPTASTLVLQDSGAVKWDVTVDITGHLVTTSGSVGAVTAAFRIQKPDASYGKLGVNTDGSLYVDDVPGVITINNTFYLQSVDLNLWQIAITNLNQLQTILEAGDGARLSIVNNVGDVLWQVRSMPGYVMLQYLRVLTTAQLTVATPPTTVTGLLPFAFLNNGTVNRLVFYDGTNWRYVHDNSLAP